MPTEGLRVSAKPWLIVERVANGWVSGRFVEAAEPVLALVGQSGEVLAEWSRGGRGPWFHFRFVPVPSPGSWWYLVSSSGRCQRFRAPQKNSTQTLLGSIDALTESSASGWIAWTDNTTPAWALLVDRGQAVLVESGLPRHDVEELFGFRRAGFWLPGEFSKTARIVSMEELVNRRWRKAVATLEATALPSAWGEAGAESRLVALAHALDLEIQDEVDLIFQLLMAMQGEARGCRLPLPRRLVAHVGEQAKQGPVLAFIRAVQARFFDSASPDHPRCTRNDCLACLFQFAEFQRRVWPPDALLTRSQVSRLAQRTWTPAGRLPQRVVCRADQLRHLQAASRRQRLRRGAAELEVEHRLDDYTGSRSEHLHPVDVHVFGMLSHRSAIGAAGVDSLRLARRLGRSVTATDISPERPLAQQIRGRLVAAKVLLVHLQPPQLKDALPFLATLLSSAQRSIAYVTWEFNRWPSEFVNCLAFFDEVWVPSEFVAAGLRQELSRPVRVLPPLIQCVPPGNGGRDYAAESRDFRGLIVFDANSGLHRKNPLAAAKAFVEAYSDPRASLVLKVRNGHALRAMASAGDPDAQALFDLVSADSRLEIMDLEMTHAETLQLVAQSSCLMSLHRAEGFGYLIAEAMALGTPVLAAYNSAVREFVDETTAWLVPCIHTKVQPGEYPAAEGLVWSEPVHADAVAQLRRLRSEPHECSARAAEASKRILSRFGEEAGMRALSEMLRN